MRGEIRGGLLDFPYTLVIFTLDNANFPQYRRGSIRLAALLSDPNKVISF